MLTRTTKIYYFIPLLFLLIYFQVFFADYAYLDEVYALWHNDDKTNYSVTQGRWLSGLIFRFFFSFISSIEQLRVLRLFSFAGWVITALVWSYIYKKWVVLMGFSKETWLLGCLFTACCVPVCIYIGWAVCMQIFLGVLAGLMSGYVLFGDLYRQKEKIRFSAKGVVGSLLFGIISLFIYQNSFGIFLIPFFLFYLQGRKAKPGRIIVTGVVFYLLTYVIYYLLFQYSLTASHLDPSNRTEIHFNFLKKLSFFFAGPFPQGFSLNLLFLARSIFSQIFYPLVFIVWLIITFKQNKQNSFGGNLLFVACILFFLALIYLPSMIATENFPPYRTLFAFNLAVFIMVTDSLLHLFQKERQRLIFIWLAASWLIITAIYTFNFQFIDPLKKEYRVLRSFVEIHYKPAIKQVYFIRADKFLFNSEFHTRVYRDELGAPSTYRDWVPEPIVKQIIFELTKKRKTAEDVTVVQFEDTGSFSRSNPVIDSASLLIDMNEIFRKTDLKRQ
jgi:hypothetical protein